MKSSLVQWSLTLGAIGSLLAGHWLSPAPALALPEEQVLQTLAPVPVFVVTEDNFPLFVVLQPNADGEAPPANVPVSGVFIRLQDAQAFVENLQQRDPEGSESLEIEVVSLAQVYELERRLNEEAAANEIEEDPEFIFVPPDDQRDNASQILEESGRSSANFSGVPLFLARAVNSDDPNDTNYLTIQRGEEARVPAYFTREQVDQAINLFREQNPDDNGNLEIEIEVISLEGFINSLQTRNEEDLSKIVLVPHWETLQLLQQASEQAPQVPSEEANPMLPEQ